MDGPNALMIGMEL